MILSMLLLYLLIGSVELYILYKKQGKSKDVKIYLSIFSLVIILYLLGMIEIIDRNFASIIKIW
ncbi:hypothetical protein [Vallitalea guaymasensis]|uniref:Uncharacterized protein n=1 Tax=Vallitalea guaymasensis TaxID=1185412 RepID=A0A8J8MCJ4_9FIRM|nr:hypothetical protein [Vallitalea guaymasensis]QUH30393.1 hypothetical protein HYG85_16355 [Vallitalea guaymasensis]